MRIKNDPIRIIINYTKFFEENPVSFCGESYTCKYRRIAIHEESTPITIPPPNMRTANTIRLSKKYWNMLNSGTRGAGRGEMSKISGKKIMSVIKADVPPKRIPDTINGPRINHLD